MAKSAFRTAYMRRVKAGLTAMVNAASVIGQAEAKKLVNQPGQGRVYTRKSGRVHRASAPGQPPAKDTGALGRSIQAADAVDDGKAIVGGFGSNSKVARWMERGTARMAPRPFHRKAARKIKGDPVIAAVGRRAMGVSGA